MTKKTNKQVYVVFADAFLLDVMGIFASNKSMDKYFEELKSEILTFAKSDDVNVTIESDKTYLGAREYYIESDIPRYNLVVIKTEVVNSGEVDISQIKKVWISYSTYDPGNHIIHLTQEDNIAHLRTIECIDQDGNLKEGTYSEYHRVHH